MVKEDLLGGGLLVEDANGGEGVSVSSVLQ